MDLSTEAWLFYNMNNESVGNISSADNQTFVLPYRYFVSRKFCRSELSGAVAKLQGAVR